MSSHLDLMIGLERYLWMSSIVWWDTDWPVIEKAWWRKPKLSWTLRTHRTWTCRKGLNGSGEGNEEMFFVSWSCWEDQELYFTILLCQFSQWKSHIIVVLNHPVLLLWQVMIHLPCQAQNPEYAVNLKREFELSPPFWNCQIRALLSLETCSCPNIMLLACKFLLSRRQIVLFKMLMAGTVGYPFNSYNPCFLISASDFDLLVIHRYIMG